VAPKAFPDALNSFQKDKQLQRLSTNQVVRKVSQDGQNIFQKDKLLLQYPCTSQRLARKDTLLELNNFLKPKLLQRLSTNQAAPKAFPDALNTFQKDKQRPKFQFTNQAAQKDTLLELNNFLKPKLLQRLSTNQAAPKAFPDALNTFQKDKPPQQFQFTNQVGVHQDTLHQCQKE
jgi:hypothetical protein